MKHYICTGGCEAVVDKPGICQAETCAKHGQPFDECNCKDGKHESISSNATKDLKTEESANRADESPR